MRSTRLLVFLLSNAIGFSAPACAAATEPQNDNACWRGDSHSLYSFEHLAAACARWCRTTLKLPKLLESEELSYVSLKECGRRAAIDEANLVKNRSCESGVPCTMVLTRGDRSDSASPYRILVTEGAHANESFEVAFRARNGPTGSTLTATVSMTPSSANTKTILQKNCAGDGSCDRWKIIHGKLSIIDIETVGKDEVLLTMR
jgi:hypothetical protein